MSLHIAAHKTMEHAAAITYAGAATTGVFWGLHVSDIALMVSCAASVIGVSLQVYVAVTKVRLMHRSQRWETNHRHDKDAGRHPKIFDVRDKP